MTFFPLFLAFLLLVPAGAVKAQTAPEVLEIPGYLFGTYDLQMEVSNPASPIPEGVTALVTLAIDGSLCSDGLILDEPFTREGVDDRVFWASEAVGLEFSLATVGEFGGFTVANFAGTEYGTLTGERTETSVSSSCDVHQVFFALAEANYPELFPGGLFVLTQRDANSFFRYYSLTDTYLTVTNGNVSARGGAFGNVPVSLGQVEELVADGVTNLMVPTTVAPPTYDDYYVGTYELTFQNAATFSPVPNGASLTFVLTQDDRLCVGETVLEAPLYVAESGSVIWSNAGGGYYYALELLPNDEKEAAIQSGAFDLYSTGGQYLGTFEGVRSQLSAECNDAQGENPDLPAINLLFELAEQRLPDLFPGGVQTYNQKQAGSIYRYYEATGITASVAEGSVYVQGGAFGGVANYVGTLDEIIAKLQDLTVPVTLPAALPGTYSVTFSSAGSFAPIAPDTVFDLAITEQGDVCLDGALLSDPYFEPDDQQTIHWNDPGSGFVLQLDLATNDGVTLNMSMLSPQGLVLGSMSGTRTLLQAECSGITGTELSRLTVEGDMLYKLASLPATTRRVSLREDGQPLPEDTSEAELETLVRNALGNELSGSSQFDFTLVTDTPNLVVFDVLIDNQAVVGASIVSRLYSLRFTYQRL